MSLPSNTSDPLVMSYSRAMQRARVDLPQPGLADQAECLAGPQLEADVVHCVHAGDLALHQDAAADREVLLDMLSPQQDLTRSDIRARLEQRQVRGCVVGHGFSSTSSGWIVASLTSFFSCLDQVTGVQMTVAAPVEQLGPHRAPLEPVPAPVGKGAAVGQVQQ